jgi:nucleotide-binding universal stress UspA family protein
MGAMSTYVVGVAGDPHAQAGLDWAAAVARPDDVIVAVHAWEIPIVTGYESVAAVDTRTIEDGPRDYLGAMVAARGDDRIRAVLAAGHPGQALADAADDGELGDDVAIVVAHNGSSKLGLVLGSTANYVVHHARRPVVVVRGEARVPVRRIVVGVDDPHDDHPDEPSLTALRWALRRPGVERLEVQHAAFVPGVAAGLMAEPAVESEPEALHLEAELAEVVVQALGGDAPPAGTDIVPVVTGGTGAFALIEASRTADLIVIGTRGHRSLRQLITGSTSLEVLAHAHCPVVVVR